MKREVSMKESIIYKGRKVYKSKGKNMCKFYKRNKMKERIN